MNVNLQSVATAACFNKARPIKDTCRFLQYYNYTCYSRATETLGVQHDCMSHTDTASGITGWSIHSDTQLNLND